MRSSTGRSALLTVGQIAEAMPSGMPTMVERMIATVINASGFLALAFSSLPPMRQFGIVTSTAFVLALLADFTALPGALWILSRPQK